MLDASALQQVKGYLDRLTGPITLTIAPDGSSESGQIQSLLKDVASVSGKITLATEDVSAQLHGKPHR